MEYGVSGWMFSHRDWIEEPDTPSFPASLPDSTYADHHRGRESPNSCEVEHENRRPSVRRDRLSVRSGVAMAGDGMNGGAAVAPAAVTD